MKKMIIVFLVMIFSIAGMLQAETFLRKYGVATTIDFVLYDSTSTSVFKTDAVSESGDCKIMKSEGTEATVDANFVDEGQGYSIALSETEMSAERIVLYISDQSVPRLWIDKYIIIETYGNASAQHPFDLGTASTAQTGDSYPIVSDLEGISEISSKIVADMDANSLLANLTADRAGYLDNIDNPLLLELGLSEISDKVVADMDANSMIPERVWEDPNASQVATITSADKDDIVTYMDANSAKLAYLTDTVPTASENASATKNLLDPNLTLAMGYALAAQTAAEKIDTASELRILIYGVDQNGVTTDVWTPTMAGYIDGSILEVPERVWEDPNASQVATITSADKDDIVVYMDANSTRASGIDANVAIAIAAIASSRTAADSNYTIIIANQVTMIADTNQLQVDWKDGGRLDRIMDAILEAETNVWTNTNQ